MNTAVKKPDAATLKKDITTVVGDAKKSGLRIVELFIAAARHYWDNSESPDVLNHLIKELETFPALQKRAITLACTFGKFEIIENDKKIPQLLNLRERDANGEVVKENGKDKRKKLTDAQKTDFKANIDAYEALQLKSLTAATSSGGKKGSGKKVSTYGETVKSLDKVLEKRFIEWCVSYDKDPVEVMNALAERISTIAADPVLAEKIETAKKAKQENAQGELVDANAPVNENETVVNP